MQRIAYCQPLHQGKMGAPQSKLQQPVENLYDAVSPSNKTAEVDLLLAGLRTLLSRSIPRYISFTNPITLCVASHSNNGIGEKIATTDDSGQIFCISHCIISCCMLQRVSCTRFRGSHRRRSSRRTHASARRKTCGRLHSSRLRGSCSHPFSRYSRDHSPSPFKFSTHTHKAVRAYGTGIKYLLVPIDLRRNVAGVH